jgi:hypothetical protein
MTLLVTRGGELAEAPGRWSGIEGEQVSEEPPAGLFRADPKRGGQKTLSCSPKLTMSHKVVAMFDIRPQIIFAIDMGFFMPLHSRNIPSIGWIPRC